MITGLFLHLPKCAGASVKVLLEARFNDKIEFSYQSYFRIPFNEREQLISANLENPEPLPENKVVYGHVFPVKHLGKTLSPSVKLTTILRDPLERMRSHYVYWNAGDFDHYLWRKMKAQNWSFSDFAFSDEMRNFYAQHSIHVPVERYDYIGLYENLDVSVRKCLSTVGIELQEQVSIPHTNANIEKRDDLISTVDHDAFKKWHAEDYRFYETAKHRFHEG